VQERGASSLSARGERGGVKLRSGRADLAEVDFFSERAAGEENLHVMLMATYIK